jgi:hypothetical protein
MSIIVSTIMPTDTGVPPSLSSPAAGVRKPFASSQWAWMILGCALLGVSGGVRKWQDHRFKTWLGQVEPCPFPLNQLPSQLGDEWSLQEEGEKSLDPEIARVAGCTASLIRVYKNATTGVSITAMVLFGPGKDVVGHIPEVCYPAAGYRMVGNASSRSVAVGGEKSADFTTGMYARPLDQRSMTQEVYYTFRHSNRWSADALRYWKDFRHHPSVFKVQVQRLISEDEVKEGSEVRNPTERFLALLMPEIERRIVQAEGRSKG